MPSFRFPAACHMRRRRDFQLVYGLRCSAADEILLVFGRFNGLKHTRLGLSVSRKVGGAVVRNRWKRLLREAFRLSRHQLPDGIDLIIIPRSPAIPSLTALLASLPSLASRLAGKLAAADRRKRDASPPSQGTAEGGDA